MEAMRVHCKPILGNPCRSPKWVMVMDKEEEPHKDGKERVCYGVVQTALGGGLHNTQCHVQSVKRGEARRPRFSGLMCSACQSVRGGLQSLP